MAIDTYTKLQTSISNWLARTLDTDLTAVIPDLITLAEADMAKKLKTFYQLRVGTAPFSSTVGIEALPERYSCMKSLVYAPKTSNKRPPIDFYDPAEFNRLRDRYASAPRPCIYTISAHNLHLWPPGNTADTDEEFEIWYYQDVEPLSGTNLSNEVLTHYPNVYLFGSLAQATIWSSDVRLPNYGGLYEDAVSKANEEGDQMTTGVSPVMSMPR